MGVTSSFLGFLRSLSFGCARVRDGRGVWQHGRCQGVWQLAWELGRLRKWCKGYTWQ